MEHIFIVYLFQALTVLVFCSYCFWAAFKYRTRYASDVAIITEFKPPHGIDAIMCGVLIDGRLNNRDVVAGVITLAEKGILEIVPTVTDNQSDYKIVYLKECAPDEAGTYDLVLLELIFMNKAPGAVVLLSTMRQNQWLKNRNRFVIKRLERLILKALVQAGFYEELTADRLFSKIFLRFAAVLAIVLLVYAVSAVYVLAVQSEQIEFSAWLVLFMLVAAFMEIAVMYRRLTLQGYQTLHILKGFTQYLQVAEKDRYVSEGTLKKDIFSYREYLAFSVALAVVKEWDGVFSDIQTYLHNEDFNPQSDT